MKRGSWALGVLLLGAACKRAAPADAGAAAPSRDDAGTAIAADAGARALAPGPPVPGTGPRTATVAESHRYADLTALHRNRAHGAAARFLEEGIREVYGDRRFAREVEKATGEPLRPPQAIALERLDTGPGPQLWRVTYEAWCGASTGGAAGYKSDHLLLSRTGPAWRLVVSYRPGCEESGDPEVILLDLDGDGREDIVASYASTRLGAENRIDLRLLRRTGGGFAAHPLLGERSPFQTLEVRYVPAAGGGRDIRFRTFREDAGGCAFFEVTVTYALDRARGTHVRGGENLRPVPPRVLVEEGEDIDPRCGSQ